jgi:hypothetical protein
MQKASHWCSRQDLEAAEVRNGMLGEAERTERGISLDDDEGGETACWAHLVDEETGTIPGANHPSRSIDPPESPTTSVQRDDASHSDVPNQQNSASPD